MDVVLRALLRGSDRALKLAPAVLRISKDVVGDGEHPAARRIVEDELAISALAVTRADRLSDQPIGGGGRGSKPECIRRAPAGRRESLEGIELPLRRRA